MKFFIVFTVLLAAAMAADEDTREKRGILSGALLNPLRSVIDHSHRSYYPTYRSYSPGYGSYSSGYGSYSSGYGSYSPSYRSYSTYSAPLLSYPQRYHNNYNSYRSYNDWTPSYSGSSYSTYGGW